jgi:hypothetical protein
METVALPLPAALTPAARAAEIAAILATAIARSQSSLPAEKAKVDLGFFATQRVYATPYHAEELP